VTWIARPGRVSTSAAVMARGVLEAVVRMVGFLSVGAMNVGNLSDEVELRDQTQDGEPVGEVGGADVARELLANHIASVRLKNGRAMGRRAARAGAEPGATQNGS
jgi:hypothetical protein